MGAWRNLGIDEAEVQTPAETGKKVSSRETVSLKVYLSLCARSMDLSLAEVSISSLHLTVMHCVAFVAL